ncbi:MAG TPA: hypothetical protein VGY57_05105 [Vicinamibacterales bacterium]|nr:hypothetical protein [Vicinamibacterales bacterium]
MQRHGTLIVCLLALCGMAQAGQSRGQTPPPAATADARTFSLRTIRQACIEFTDVKKGTEPTDLRDCRVTEFGEFGSVERQTYYYAIYCLVPNDTAEKGNCEGDSFNAQYYSRRGLAIFAAPPRNDNARLLFERADLDLGLAVYPDKPEILTVASGTMLYIPIQVDGTGAGNESEYYLREAGQWIAIDAESWLADLSKRIPAGLEIWKGVWPNVHTMRAEAGLYRRSDANCCPTGGRARIQLSIRSRRFVIESLTIEKPVG